MANEYAVRCGDAVAPLPALARPTLSLRAWGKDANIDFQIEDLRQRLWAEPPAVFLDLLDLAAYIYAADQASRRGPGDDGNYWQGWRRRFHCAIPVRQPDFWGQRAVRDALVSALSFLAEDEYHFHFEKLGRATPAQQYFRFSTDRFGGAVEEVVLFSGGLDSLAGAATEALVNKRQVALVHHRCSSKIDPVVQSLVGELVQRAGRTRPLLLPVRLTKDSSLGRERTMRSRSFLFASLAGAMAHMLGLNRIRFYENGVVSVNLPLATQVVGSRASRTTHPRVLAGFGQLLSLVADRPFVVDNPFLWQTKADVVRAIASAGCADLIGRSRSCAHPVTSSRTQPHCGVCSQCLDRRFAELAAGLAAHDPAQAYVVDLLTGVRQEGRDQAMLAVYVETALRLARCNQAQFFARYGEAARVLGCFLEPAESVAARLFDLHKRHGRDVKRVLDDAVKAHSGAIVDRSLPAGCLVRMVLGSGASEPPAAPAEPPLAENVYRRSGKAWQVRFAGGREFILPPSKGAAYLHLLLQRPDRPTSAADLMLTVARRRGQLLPGDAGEVVDREALTAYRARYQELVAMIDKERKAADSVVAEQLERERVALLEEIQKVMGRKGKPRRAASDRDKVRVAVRTAIRRALAQIRVEDRRLVDHLSPPRLLCGYSPSQLAAACAATDQYRGKGHGQKLTSRQEGVIAALLTEATYAAAARQGGVSETTLYRWLRLEEFQAAYRQARRELLDAALARMQAASGQVVETLLSVARQGRKEGDRVRAAVALLDRGIDGLLRDDLLGASRGEAARTPMGTAEVVRLLASRLRQVDASTLPTAEKSRLTATLADALLRAIGVDVLDQRLEALQAVLQGRKEKP